MTRSHRPLGSAARALRSSSCWLALSLALTACGGDDDTADPGPGAGGSAGKTTGKSGSGGASGKAGSSAGGTSGASTGGTSTGGTSAGGTASGGSGQCPSGQQLCGSTCANLLTDPTHCGSCDRSCDRPHSQVTCEAGQCVFQACQAGFGDCNGKPTDGCEVDLKGGTTCPCAPGQSEPCYDGAMGTEGVGPCHGGTHVCKDDGTGYGTCTGQVTPSLDSCADEIDQDCNGTLYKCTGANEVCGSGGTCTDPCSSEELGTSYIGCTYYPAVTPNNGLVSPQFDYAVAISNTNAVETTVTITRGAATVSQVTVAPNSVQVVILPWIAELKNLSTGSIQMADGAYKLVATRPVTVYQYNPLQYQKGGSGFLDFSYSNDASLLLPVNTWRNEYIVVSRAHWLFSGGTFYSGFYAVVASEDNTTVTVAGSATTLNVKGGVAGVDAQGNGTFVLGAGGIAVFATGGTSEANDLTGSRVKSDKPVEVIGGHDCTYVPVGVPACDHLEEALFPVETLANEYLVAAPLIPNGNVPKANIVRMVATDPDTTFTYDPPQAGAPTTIAQAGGWIEFTTDQSFRISSNKRFLAAQYALGQQAGGDSGDPDLALVVPTAQYRSSYLFHAPTSYAQNFVTITAPTGASVVLDGAPVSGFAPIGTTGYGVLRLPLPSINDGNHTITGDQNFGISVYGYGQYTSYWYPGGLDLRGIKF